MKVSEFSRYFRGLALASLIGIVSTALAAEPGVPMPPEATVSTEPLTNLVFDAERKEYHAKPGDPLGIFVFQMTNISDVPIHIISIVASCSCTRAEMPQTPWIIAPHSHEELHATMRIENQPPGERIKYLTVASTNGTKQLWVKSIIPPPTAAMGDREKNQALAKADRQAVFKNDCASCHVEKSKGLVGAALYKEACGICHDSDHRASMVPNLRALNHPTDANFWRLLTTEGKENTLMPAFSQERGGPLSKEQIDSLVKYLTTEFPTPEISQDPIGRRGGKRPEFEVH